MSHGEPNPIYTRLAIETGITEVQNRPGSRVGVTGGRCTPGPERHHRLDHGARREVRGVPAAVIACHRDVNPHVPVATSRLRRVVYPMPEPREMVAKVLRRHEWINTQSLCGCGWNPDWVPVADHFAHVADEVLAALTQEWGASDAEEPDDPGAWMADRGWAERYAKSEGGKVFTRFVTPWVGVHA